MYTQKENIVMSNRKIRFIAYFLVSLFLVLPAIGKSLLFRIPFHTFGMATRHWYFFEALMPLFSKLETFASLYTWPVFFFTWYASLSWALFGGYNIGDMGTNLMLVFFSIVWCLVLALPFLWGWNKNLRHNVIFGLMVAFDLSVVLVSAASWLYFTINPMVFD